MKKLVWIILATMLVAVGTFVKFRWSDMQHRRQFARVTASFHRLEPKCPPKITKEEWASQLSWLDNLAGNCLASANYVPTREVAQLADELERLVAGKVDLHTINWIWDEVARISKHGSDYSDRFRPTSTERRLLEGFPVDPETMVEKKK